MTPIDMAVENLIKKLDNTPRSQWAPMIMITMQAVKDLGYADGYRVGSFKVEGGPSVVDNINESLTKLGKIDQDSFIDQDGFINPAYAPTGSGAAAPFTSPGGEDRTLENKAEKEADRHERMGWEALGEVARQIGEHIDLGNFELRLGDPRILGRGFDKLMSCIVLTEKG